MLVLYLLWCHHLLSLCVSMKSFDAYRVLQYEKNQRPLGSSKSTVDNLISPIDGDHDLGRNVGVISIEDLNLRILETLSSRRCQSLLIILPNPNDNTTLSHIYSDSFSSRFVAIEHYLMTNAFDFSIFFAFNDGDVMPRLLHTANDLFDIYGTKDVDYAGLKQRQRQRPPYAYASPLMSPFAMHDLYHLRGSEASSAIHSVKFSNLFARIERRHGANTNKKYIVVAANHDSFGVVPQLAFGVNDNGSGMTAIMCLMNLFYKLYEEEKDNDVLQYDLLFLLSAGGYTNYKGSTKWIEEHVHMHGMHADIEMVICIDSIGIGDELYGYTTPSFSEDLRGLFVSKARAHAIDGFEIKTQSIESDTRLNGWHHEEFARNKVINAITISSKKDKYLTWNGTSILDNINRIDFKMLYRNVEYVSSVLQTLIYNKSDTQHHINERYMNNYMNWLNRVPRFGPYHHKSAYLKKLKSDFQLNSHETHIQQYAQNEMYEKFYSTDTVTIAVFDVKPYSFDFAFMCATLLYLFVFYIILNAPKTWPQFRDLFLVSH